MWLLLACARVRVACNTNPFQLIGVLSLVAMGDPTMMALAMFFKTNKARLPFHSSELSLIDCCQQGGSRKQP